MADDTGREIDVRPQSAAMPSPFPITDEEGSFASFRLVSALSIVGDVQPARDQMDRLLRIG